VANVDDARIRTILESSPTVAVLGIHDDQARPAYYVPEYLHEQGYEIYGVNPTIAGRELFGHAVVGSLAELPVPIDLIDVFRRSEWIPEHVGELIAAKPRVVWMQLGVRSDAAAAALEKAGIEVVMDRCTLADHRRLRLGRPHR
jgi:hypothetical protein